MLTLFPLTKTLAWALVRKKPELDGSKGVVCLEPGLFKGKITEQGYHEGLLDNTDEAELLSTC